MSRDPLLEKLFEFGEDLIPGLLGGIAFTDDVPDIVPDTGTGTAVARYWVGGSDGTLLGQGAIGQVVLAEHLDMNAEFLDLIGGENPFQDVVGFPIESTERNIEEAHFALSGGILTELLFMVGYHHCVGVGFPGLL